MSKNLTTESYSYMLRESLAEGGFKALTIKSMSKNLTTESYHDISNEGFFAPFGKYLVGLALRAIMTSLHGGISIANRNHIQQPLP